MKQFRIQKEREKAEMLENLEEVENKLKSVQKKATSIKLVAPGADPGLI